MAEFVDAGEYRELGEGEHLYIATVLLLETGRYNLWRVVAHNRDQAIFAVLRQYKVGQIVLEDVVQADFDICRYCGLVGGH